MGNWELLVSAMGEEVHQPLFYSFYEVFWFTNCDSSPEISSSSARPNSH